MSNLALIQPQRADFDTCQVAGWTDGFPLIGLAEFGGSVAGANNIGNGGLSIVSIAAGTRRGAHVAAVTAISGGLTRFTVTDPDGDVTGAGVVGLPLDAGGLRLTLTQGTAPFAVGDDFALSTLTAPIDLTGLRFTLIASMNSQSATIMLAGDTVPDDGSAPTLLSGGVSGTLAAYLPRALMGRCPPGDYPYTILATDLTTDPEATAPVIGFYGTIRHRTVFAPASIVA